PGDYEYFLWKRAQELDAEAEDEEEQESTARRNGRHPERSRAARPRTPTADRRELVKALDRAERRLAQMETAVEELEERIRARDRELESETLYQDHERWHALHLERRQWDQDLEQLMEAWAQQSEQVAALQQQIEAYDQGAERAN